MSTVEATGMEATAVDVVVVGAGPIGLVAALAMAQAGFDTALVGPRTPPDPRTTALLGASVDLIRDLGAWPEAEAAPLVEMRILDDTGRLVRAPAALFEARELGLEAFGWNVPAAALVTALRAAVAEAGITVVAAPATAIVPADTAGDGRAVVVADGRRFAPRLVVAADGAASPARAAAGIAVHRWQHRQAALVTTLAHAAPHRGVSTEIHTATGPFTLVPLPGDRSSLVWVERPAEAERLAALDDATLAMAIERRAHAHLGAMRIDGPRAVVPLGGHVARRFAAGRIVLVGEAAHRLPPIGAQGMNLGLRDVAVLARRAAASPADPGAAAVLDGYERDRRPDAALRTAAVEAVDLSLLTGFLPVQLGRAGVLWATSRLGPVRRAVMRRAMGATG